MARRSTKKKFCPVCNEEHSVSEFGKDRNAKDGLYRICKVADRAQQKAWRERKKAEVAAK